MGVISGFVEGIAKDFAIDTAIDKWNDYAGEHIKTKDPYRYETPEGKTKKLKLRESATKEEQKMWKWVQKRAWVDDKCFMGCYPVDCGIGLGPIVVMLPVIGPLLMYAVHARLITRAGMFYKLDAATTAKLQANILFDLMLTFPPVVGSLFAWMNGCSTRNAAIIHTEVTKMLLKREFAGANTNNVTDNYPLQDVNKQNVGNQYQSANNNSKTNTAVNTGSGGTSNSNPNNRPPIQSKYSSNQDHNSNFHINIGPTSVSGPALPSRDYVGLPRDSQSPQQFRRAL